MKNTLSTMRVLVLAGVTAAVALTGCGADIPAQPTWVEDVYPILLARCVRCHNAAMTADPGEMPSPINFDFPDFDSAKTQGATILLSVSGLADIRKGVMPKKPAAPLADWQIETIARWAKNQR